MLNHFTRSLKSGRSGLRVFRGERKFRYKSVKNKFQNLKSYTSDCTTYVILSKLTWMRSNVWTLISS